MSDNPYAQINVEVLKRREAAALNKFATVPHAVPYTVGQHNHNALSLLLMLHPDPPMKLIKAVHALSYATRWLGDVPRPAFSIEAIKQAFGGAGSSILGELKVPTDLTPEELRWLTAVDTLAEYYWTMDELAMGNRNVSQQYELLRNGLTGLDMPEQCKLAFSAAKWGRTAP